MGFIQDYLSHTQIYESPTSFWKWSSYSAISSVLRDSCWLPQGDNALYPNVYVLLLASSAIQRKGRPVKLCEELVTCVNNTKIISGRASIQAVLDELSSATTDPHTGNLVKGGSAILLAEELAAAIVSDPSALSILTDLYDYKANFTSRLRSRGKTSIQKVVFSMFGASNEELLKSIYTQDAIYGGLLSRTFLVVPDEFRQSNSLLSRNGTQNNRDAAKKSLVDKLKEISKLKGAFIFSEEAITEYESWYVPFRNSYKNKPDKSGILGRIHSSILKLAMIFTANELSLKVTKLHVELAIEEGMKLIPNYNQFVIASGKSSISEAGALLIQDLYIADEHKLSRKVVLRKHWANFDAETLDKLVTTLQQGELLQVYVQGSETVYQLTDKALELMGRKSSGVETSNRTKNT
ncbi:MAG: hypothetical protein ACREHG_03320 [Candidatus Saccharimonadales bacterium]